MDTTVLIQRILSEEKILLEDLTIDESQVFLQMQLYGDVAQWTDEFEDTYWIIPVGSGLSDG